MQVQDKDHLTAMAPMHMKATGHVLAGSPKRSGSSTAQSRHVCPDDMRDDSVSSIPCPCNGCRSMREPTTGGAPMLYISCCAPPAGPSRCRLRRFACMRTLYTCVQESVACWECSQIMRQRAAVGPVSVGCNDAVAHLCAVGTENHFFGVQQFSAARPSFLSERRTQNARHKTLTARLRQNALQWLSPCMAPKERCLICHLKVQQDRRWDLHAVIETQTLMSTKAQC